MLLHEFEDRDLETGQYDPAADKLGRRDPSDTRKPTLTLKALNRLKRMRALKKLEDTKRQDLFGIMYATPDMPGPGGPPGF